MSIKRVIAPDASTVAVLTGHLLKDPEATVNYHLGKLEGIVSGRVAAPVVVDATYAAVSRILEESVR